MTVYYAYKQPGHPRHRNFLDWLAYALERANRVRVGGQRNLADA